VKKGTKEGTKKELTQDSPRGERTTMMMKLLLALRQCKQAKNRSSSSSGGSGSRHTIYTITAPLPISAASSESECRKREVASDAPKSTIATTDYSVAAAGCR
jgi:hypothetical protein